MNAVLEMMTGHVARGHRQRAGIDIRCVHLRFRKSQGAGDRDATAASSQIKHAADRRRIEPRRKTARDPLGQRRAGNQHPLVDEERQTREPRLAGKVGGRPALANAPVEQAQDGEPLLRREPGVEIAGVQIKRQMDRLQRQTKRLVQRIVGAMAEMQAGGVEAAGAPANAVGEVSRLSATCSSCAMGYPLHGCNRL